LYDKKYKEYRQSQNELQDKMSKLQKADEEYYITCGYLLKLASKAGELFESSEPAEKREILKLLLQNCTLNGTSVCYDLKNRLILCLIWEVVIFGSPYRTLYEV